MTDRQLPPGRFLLAAVFSAAMVLAATDAHAEHCVPPLPTGFALGPPSADLAPEFARFHGVWGNGDWDGLLCHILVVNGIAADGTVDAIYSVGDYAPWNVAAAYYTVHGRIDGDSLVLDPFPNGGTVTYRIAGDALAGRYVLGETISTISLSRIP